MKILRIYIRHIILQYGSDLAGSRLKSSQSRKTFLKTTFNRPNLSQTPEVTRIDLWKEVMKGHN